MDILKDPQQLKFFEYFLGTKENNSQARLQFWLAVEELKAITKTSSLKHHVAKIEQRFLGRKAEKSGCGHHLGGGAKVALIVHLSLYVWYCTHQPVVGSQVAEFLGAGRLTMAKLLTAQAMIADYMESTWYKPYLDYLRADEEQDKKPSSLVVQEAIEHKRSFHCKERTVRVGGRGDCGGGGQLYANSPHPNNMTEAAMEDVCAPGSQL